MADSRIKKYQTVLHHRFSSRGILQFSNFLVRTPLRALSEINHNEPCLSFHLVKGKVNMEFKGGISFGDEELRCRINVGNSIDERVLIFT